MSPPRKKDGCIDWEGIYQKGENPAGMRSQTADETVTNARALPTQDYHFNQSADGPRWNDGFQPSLGEDVAIPASGRSKVGSRRKK